MLSATCLRAARRMTPSIERPAQHPVEECGIAHVPHHEGHIDRGEHGPS